MRRQGDLSGRGREFRRSARPGGHGSSGPAGRGSSGPGGPIVVGQPQSPTAFPSGSVKMANLPNSPGRSVGGTTRVPPSLSARSR
jgi:hypothetical protein